MAPPQPCTSYSTLGEYTSQFSENYCSTARGQNQFAFSSRDRKLVSKPGNRSLTPFRRRQPPFSNPEQCSDGGNEGEIMPKAHSAVGTGSENHHRIRKNTRGERVTVEGGEGGFSPTKDRAHSEEGSTSSSQRPGSHFFFNGLFRSRR